MKDAYEYDAFVIYNPVGDDLDFINSLVETMEAPPYNLKFFIPTRDASEHAMNHQLTKDLIENRCRKCIAVLSRNFWDSETAEFQLQYAHCLSPANRQKRILPICLDDCEIPSFLKLISKIDYHNKKTRPWFWNRLAIAFQTPPSTPENDSKAVDQKSVRNDTEKLQQNKHLLPDIVADINPNS